MSATVLASGTIDRYSGFTNLLPKKWAGFATYHGRALPTELSRLIALVHINWVFKIFQFSLKQKYADDD